MDLAKLAGLGAIRLTAQWQRGETAPQAADVQSPQNAVNAANLDGIVIYVSVYPSGSSQTPRSATQQAQFTSFAASLAKSLPTVRRFIIGNEPNLNRFWMPQYGSNGRDLAAPAYEALLAKTYDALKAVSPSLTVIGGAVSPRGNDTIQSNKHSPTSFITDLGKAYRASGRRRPIMDAFSLHPYEDNSSIPPTLLHRRSTTISIADYPKLIKLLGKASNGTAQPGSKLPIVYDEFGVQSVIPHYKRSVYFGLKPLSERPVMERTQAAYYSEALALAACQPTVTALLIFHVADEPNLDRWQSGLYYADDTPKTSLSIVHHAINLLTVGAHAYTTPAARAFAKRAANP
jgi:hypothetical protein